MKNWNAHKAGSKVQVLAEYMTIIFRRQLGINARLKTTQKNTTEKEEEKPEKNIKCFVFSWLSATTFVLHIY